MFKLFLFIPLFFIGCTSQPNIPVCPDGDVFVNGECIKAIVKKSGVVADIKCVPLYCDQFDITLSLDDGAEMMFQTSDKYFLGQIIEVDVF